MNRLISAVMAVLMAAAGSAVGGYWNPQGVVPIGDARIPAQFVGWLITIAGGIGGLSAGAAVPWRTWIGKAMSAAKSATEAASPDASTDATVVRSVTVKVRAAIDRIDDVPGHAEMLNRCMYHIRQTLKDDAEAQDLLDQIAVKVGRATAGVKGGAA